VSHIKSIYFIFIIWNSFSRPSDWNWWIQILQGHLGFYILLSLLMLLSEKHLPIHSLVLFIAIFKIPWI
jgi:hypothetical protein